MFMFKETSEKTQSIEIIMGLSQRINIVVDREIEMSQEMDYEHHNITYLHSTECVIKFKYYIKQIP